VAEGDWLLTFLEAARERISEERAAEVNAVLDLVQGALEGEPSATELAREIKHVLLNALQVARHYGVDQELSASIENSYQTLVKEGWIREEGGSD